MILAKSKLTYFFLLCFFGIYFHLQLYIFIKGFLLKRKIITAKNDYSGFENLYDFFKDYENAIFILLDGLRYDFVGYTNHSYVYKDKLTILQELIHNKPFNAKLFQFKADPPTTTMQRISSLMTGTYPTFIDMSSNFYTYELMEDNLIQQFHNNLKRIAFLGDDTWTALFPNEFNISFAYPSFNVMDLDTVDKHVMKNIFPLILSKNYEIIIAHLLGIDHCGHKFGPYHPEMQRKLLEYDSFIRNIIANISENTILFIFSDHGMTNTGNHGGDSQLELHSFLLVYSSSPVFNLCENNFHDTMLQIDFASTVSLILKVPIPFSNVGSVFPPLIPCEQNVNNNKCNIRKCLINKLNAYWINFLQLQKYLTFKQKEIFQDLTNIAKMEIEILNLWNKTSFDVTATKDLLILEAKFQNYFFFVKKACEKVWTQYDLIFIIKGIIGFFSVGIFLADLILTKSLHFYLLVLYVIVFPCAQLIEILFPLNVLTYSICILFICSALFCVLHILKSISLFQNMNFYVNMLLLLFLFLSSFSNSFVIHEDYIMAYLFISVLFLLGFQCFHKCYKLQKETILKYLDKKSENIFYIISNNPLLVIVGIIFLVSVLCKISFLNKSCREEHIICKSAEIVKFLKTMCGSIGIEILKFICSTSCCLIIICGESFISGILLRSYKISISKYLPYTLVFFIILYWLVDILNAFSLFHQLFLKKHYIGRCVFFSFFINFVYIILKSKYLENYYSSSSFCKTTERTYLKKYFIPYISINLQLFIVFAFLSTASYGIIIFNFWITLKLLLLLHCLTFIVTSMEDIFQIPWTLTFSLYCLASHYFYCLGYQATITSIPWKSAFLCQQGELTNYFISVLLILMSLYGSHIICAFMLPLFIVYTMCIKILLKTYVWNKTSCELFHRNESQLLQSLGQISLKYLMYYALKMCGSICAAAILRRHLMVWKIFAPKLIFDAFAFLLATVSLILMYFLMIILN